MNLLLLIVMSLLCAFIVTSIVAVNAENVYRFTGKYPFKVHMEPIASMIGLFFLVMFSVLMNKLFL